jgi:hypothetical protein
MLIDIGTTFDLPTLATISGLEPKETARGLWKALVAGLITTGGENYFVIADYDEPKDMKSITPAPTAPSALLTSPVSTTSSSSSSSSSLSSLSPSGLSLTPSPSSNEGHVRMISTSEALASFQAMKSSLPGRLPTTPSHHRSEGKDKPFESPVPEPKFQSQCNCYTHFRST